MLCEVLHELRGLKEEEVIAWVASVQETVKTAILKVGGKKSGPKLVLLGKVGGHLKKKSKYRVSDAIRCVDVSDEVSSAVRTIHKAKGLEAEAVLLVADKGHLAQWLNCADSGKPRTEESRIGNVGLSRAFKLLCIATDTLGPEGRETLAKCGAVVVELKATDSGKS